MRTMETMARVLPFLAAVTLAGTLSGCANLEVNTTRGSIPGYYIRSEMQEADRAVEAARKAGKDQACPAEFKAAEDAKNNAYDVFRACHTEEGAALAKAATAKANALCSQSPPLKVVAPAPAPAALTPTAALKVTPATVMKGESATLTWKSQNASGCDIQPGIGQVPPQGARPITPVDTTSYTLSCSGEGGAATSAAGVTVVVPPPPVPVALTPKAAEAAKRFCSKPAILNIQFDTDKSDIKPQYEEDLKNVGEFLKEFPKAKGEISGHTDNVGSNAYNQKLSERRAVSVEKFISTTFAIDAGRITTKGYGEAKPISSNKTKAGKALNRRIEANFTCE